MPSRLRVGLPLALVTLLAGAIAPAAFAHRLDINVHVIGDHIVVQAQYHDETPATGAEVTVTDPDHNILAAGKIDELGEYEFGLHSIPSQLAINVFAGDGHTANKVIPAADLAGLILVEDEAHADHPATDAAQTPTERELLTALDHMNSELENVQRQLSELRQQRRSTFDSALNGLAFIIGIVGVAAYILSRKGAAPGSR